MGKQIIIDYQEYLELSNKQTLEEWSLKFILGLKHTPMIPIGESLHSKVLEYKDPNTGFKYEVKTEVKRIK